MDAGELKYNAHAASRNDAGSRGGGLDQDFCRALVLQDLMRNGAGDDRNEDNALLRGFHALADRIGNRSGLTQADADVPLAITNNDQRAPTHRASAFGRL